MLPPINSTYYIGTLYYISHIKFRNPKLQTIHHYIWNNLILQGRDISRNPSPSPPILKQMPKNFQTKTITILHKKKNTTTLKIEYEHLVDLFLPIIQLPPNHLNNNPIIPPSHPPHTTTPDTPIQHLLYTLIVSISPTLA